MTNVGMNPYTGLPYNQGNFNGITVPGAVPVNDQIKESPAGNAASDFPTTPDEFIKAAPYYAVGAGAGYGIMKGINKVCNPDGAYADSKLAKWAGKIDGNQTVQNANSKVEGWLNSTKTKVDSFCKTRPPKTKEIIASIKKGTEPELAIAKSQYHGVSGMAADQLVNELKSLKDNKELTAKQREAIDKFLKKNLSGPKLLEEIKNGGLDFCKDINITTSRTIKIPFTKTEIPMGNKTLNLNLMLNKTKGLMGAEAKTFVSRILQKAGLIAGEAASGTIIGGGVIGLAFSAFFIGGSLKKAMEAPKGEKVSTFMEEFLTNYFGFFVTMPIAMKALYKTAGLKYLGTDHKIADTNMTIRERLKQLSEGKYASKEEALVARKEMKELKSLANKGLSFPQKALKFFGRILDVGNGRLPAATAMQKVGKFLKGFGGGAMRFAIIMFAIAPLLTKPFTWLSHAIFGTPTATKEAEKKANEATNNTANNNSPFVNNSNQAAPTVNQNAAPAPTQTAANSNPQQPVRTYIPSPEPAVFQTQQNSNVTNVLSKSDSVMNYANNVLQNKH